MATCALTPAGQAYCWGRNALRVVGDGTNLNERWTPTAVVNGAGFAALSLGSEYSCGVRTNGSAWCWGFNSGGLGDGTRDSRTTPVPVLGGHTWQRLSAGMAGQHTCGVTTAQVAYCWGDNARGQVGDGTTETRLTPVGVIGPS